MESENGMDWESEGLTVDLVLRGGLDVEVEWAVPGGREGGGAKSYSIGSHFRGQTCTEGDSIAPGHKRQGEGTS